ncbi:unnamed protein product [Calypogeia fissa]
MFRDHDVLPTVEDPVTIQNTDGRSRMATCAGRSSIFGIVELLQSLGVLKLSERTVYLEYLGAKRPQC